MLKNGIKRTTQSTQAAEVTEIAKAPAKRKTTKMPAKSPSKKRVKTATVPVALVLDAPQANCVSVCGEFNDWSPEATPMQRLNDRCWEAKLTLQPGRYQYNFVADGQWFPDPQAHETVPDGHGAVNSVIQVANN